MSHRTASAVVSWGVRLACLAVAAGVVSACAGGEPRRCDESAVPPTLRIAVANPTTARVQNRNVLRLWAATLLGVDRHGEPRPALAKAWKTDDRRTWTLTLREGLRSQGGTPLTADAIRGVLLPRLPGLAAYSPVWRDVQAIEAPASSTLVFRLSRPSSAFAEALAEGEVLDEGTGPSFVAGPFRLTGETADEMAYTTFPGFWDGPPKLASLRVRFFVSPRAAWAAFLRDEVDLLYQVPPDVLPLLAKDPEVQVFDGGSRQVAVLGFQQRHRILRDVRVRRALNLAIDRDEIARRFLSGGSNGERGPFFADYWAARDAGTVWPYDPAAARAVLADVTAGGRKPLELECLTTSEYPGVSDVAAALEAQLLRVHVRLKLRALPSPELYRRLAAGEFELYAMPMRAGRTGLWPYIFWHSRAPQRYLRSGYTAADDALDAWYTAGSRDAERDAVRAVLDVMRRDPPAAFLGPMPAVRVARRPWRIPADAVDLRESLPQWMLASPPGCGGS